jgi:periplasmic copper chaperone A
MTARAHPPKRRRRPGWLPVLGLALAGATGASLRAAPPPPAGPPGIEVRQPWVRWLPAGLPAAGYLTLVNISGEDRTLTGATSPDYASVMLHVSYTLPNGDMSMRPISRLRVPAHGEQKLSPGGYHLMLMRQRHPIKPGDTVTVDLKFADGRILRVGLPVKPAGQTE